jgi:hypothetical protein
MAAGTETLPCVRVCHIPTLTLTEVRGNPSKLCVLVALQAVPCTDVKAAVAGRMAGDAVCGIGLTDVVVIAKACIRAWTGERRKGTTRHTLERPGFCTGITDLVTPKWLTVRHILIRRKPWRTLAGARTLSTDKLSICLARHTHVTGRAQATGAELVAGHCAALAGICGCREPGEALARVRGGAFEVGVVFALRALIRVGPHTGRTGSMTGVALRRVGVWPGIAVAQAAVGRWPGKVGAILTGITLVRLRPSTGVARLVTARRHTFRGIRAGVEPLTADTFVLGWAHEFSVLLTTEAFHIATADTCRTDSMARKAEPCIGIAVELRVACTGVR